MRKKLLLGTALVAAIGALAAPARAGESGRDFENEELRRLVREQGDQIRRLEKKVTRFEERSVQQLSDDIERYLSAAETEGRQRQAGTLGGGISGDRIRLGGYFSIEYRDDGDGRNSEFDQHRLVPKIQADIAEGITFETEIEIEGGGADVGFLSGNEILVEYAELAFDIIDGKLVFKAGLILVPWGRFNFFHDDPLNDLTDRPLVSRRIGAVAFDQAGIAVAGTLEPNRAGWFIDYNVALVQGFDDDFSTNGGVRDARQSFRADNNNNKQVFGRVVVSPPTRWLDVLEVGVSFAYGKHDDSGELSNYGYGIEVFFKRGPFEFVAEYMMLRIEQPDAAPQTDPRRMDGWYVEVRYHVFVEGWRGRHVLFTDESTFTFVVRVEGIDLNHSTTGATFRDDLNQVSIGFNFRPVEKTVFKISYTFVDSDEAGFDSGSADKVILSWATYF